MSTSSSTVASPAPSSSASRDWFIVSRWEELEGESRANLLRVVAILLFYAVELVNYHGLDLGFVQMPREVSRPFHQGMTLLTVAWSLLCLAVYGCITQRFFPPWLKYASPAAIRSSDWAGPA